MAAIKISLAAARVNAKLTQGEAAKAMHVTNNTIVNWEAGRTSPSLEQATALSDLYKIPLANIVLPSKSN